MSARTDSDPDSEIEDDSTKDGETKDGDVKDTDGELDVADTDGELDGEDADDEFDFEDARRARWTATGTGALLTLAGVAASLLRLTGPAPALVPAAYALGAAVCAVAALLGSRGRTRRALWLLIAGVVVMAFGDQAD